MNDSPVFIHSLFRAGSTYLFNVFRRSETNGYWCYQEPLHEMTFFLKDKPSDLLNGFASKEAEINRHPQMKLPYFQELCDVWPAWKEALSETAIYDAYFSPCDADIGTNFWQTLIDVSKARPVIQECRTSGRIAPIKEKIGGYHIYLWRNPWDQWWSYKVTDYFDIANQVIINASYIPKVIKELRNHIAFDSSAHVDIAELFNYFALRPLTAENSYLIFYTLWCLGLHEGLKNADMILNIDRLSESPEYRIEIEHKLLEADIAGIDFSDCSVPQGFYQKTECDFFEELEIKVHNWLMLSGWTQSDIDKIVSIKSEFEPTIRQKQIENLNPELLVEQTNRSRKLANHYQNRVAIISSHSLSKLSEMKAENLQLIVKAEQSESKLSEMKAENLQLILKAEQSEARAEQVQSTLQSILNSRSWRLTAPIRLIGPKIRSLSSSLKQREKIFLQHAALYIGRRPKLKKIVLRLLNYVPRFKSRLYSLQVESPSSISQFQNTSDDIKQLTPRVRGIYSQLKQGIEKRGRDNAHCD